MIWDVVRKLSKRCQVPECKSSANYRNEHKKCFSSHDVQVFIIYLEAFSAYDEQQGIAHHKCYKYYLN